MQRIQGLRAWMILDALLWEQDKAGVTKRGEYYLSSDVVGYKFGDGVEVLFNVPQKDIEVTHTIVYVRNVRFAILTKDGECIADYPIEVK